MLKKKICRKYRIVIIAAAAAGGSMKTCDYRRRPQLLSLTAVSHKIPGVFYAIISFFFLADS